MNQPLFPSNFAIEQLWFWREYELETVGNQLAALLGATSSSRDYEDTWEWIDVTLEDGSRLNLSRMHNWRSGVYSDPVIISLHGSFLNRECLLRTIREAVKRAFACKVFGGEISHTQDGQINICDSIEL